MKSCCIKTRASRARHASTTLAAICVAGLMAVSGCSLLTPTAAPASSHYSLDLDAPSAAVPATPVTPPAPSATGTATKTLIVNPTRAAAGFDSQRIIYLREAHKLEYFANSEWVDPPARMLGALIVKAIERSGIFGAVVLSAGAAAGEVRLDTEIVRLQHEFLTSPSRVRFTLRATLVDDKTRRVLAWREFDVSVAAGSDDPYGGVLAANQAVQGVLSNLSQFLTEKKP